MKNYFFVSAIFVSCALMSAQASSCEFSSAKKKCVQPLALSLELEIDENIRDCEDCYEKPALPAMSPIGYMPSLPVVPQQIIRINNTLIRITEEIFLTCGDSTINDPIEQCDDGNRVNGDGCNSICQIEVCGNAIIDDGENCDDGNINNDDGCSTTCHREYCGDGTAQTGEQCDDGNVINNDTCDSLCRTPVCGDGNLQGSEQCDDGNTVSGDGCNNVCVLEFCGNGVTNLYEQCDDGNRIDGDGCSSICRTEGCGNSTVDPSRGEECDDGNTTNNDKCSSTCLREYCGDSITQTDEACDDGNTSNADACDNFCRIPVCGNGTIEGVEKCDDDNTISGDGCNANCTVVTIAENCVDLVDNDLDGKIDVYDADCKMVFATSASMTSTMTPTPAVTGCTGSGITNADCICNALAAASSLDYINDSLGDKTWVAFLSSTSGGDAIARLTHAGYYLNANKLVVAESIADLVDADPLLNAISRNESNVAVTGSAWTGSNSSGTNSGSTCGSWANVLLNGTRGTVTETSSTWINSGSLLACLLASSARIYCFEI